MQYEHVFDKARFIRCVLVKLIYRGPQRFSEKQKTIIFTTVSIPT